MPVFSHGDLTPSQLLFDGPRAGLLDFDKCCSAEAALDLGQFLAYLKFGLSKRGASRIDELPARFLQAYEAAGGTCPPAARIRAYEMAALVRIAARSWLQLKPQRLRVACEVIERELSRSRPA